MAAVTNPASLTDFTLGPAYITPPGMEHTDMAYATTDIKRGDPVKYSGVAPSRQYDYACAAATAGDAVGLAIKTVKAGGMVEIAKKGEFDGYVGLTPDALLTVASGKIDNTAPVNTVHYSYRIRALTSTRIFFDFV